MRYTILFLAAALLALAALAQGHAQEPPIQLSPPVQPTVQHPVPIRLPGSGTGSISGRIVFQGHPFPSEQFQVYVIPVEILQPFDLGVLGFHGVSTDRQGNFTASGLKEGDYYVFPERSLELAVALPDSVRWVTGRVESRRPALRVSLADGQAVTGIEIVVRGIQVIPVIDDFGRPLSPPVAIAPVTGTGPGGGDRTVGYIAAGLAGLAALLLAGGAALRVRGSRSR